VVEKTPPSPLTGEQYGKMELKYPFLTSPFILNNSVETASPFNVISHP